VCLGVETWMRSMKLKCQGLSIRAIGRLTGYDRKTIRRCLGEPASRPMHGPRVAAPSKLESFKPYLRERPQVGVWNAAVLLREIRERSYDGSYTILTNSLRPQHGKPGETPLSNPASASTCQKVGSLSSPPRTS
jgi:transposase